MNRNAIFAGGVRPHHYCLPVLKREVHRQALLDAVTSGQSALLPRHRFGAPCEGRKEAACGCAGCYTSHAGIELYAEAFDRPERSTGWKRLPVSTAPTGTGCRAIAERITLRRESWQVKDSLQFADGDVLVPLRAGESVAWRWRPVRRAMRRGVPCVTP
jgi:dihydroorotase